MGDGCLVFSRLKNIGDTFGHKEKFVFGHSYLQTFPTGRKYLNASLQCLYLDNLYIFNTCIINILVVQSREELMVGPGNFVNLTD